MRASKLHKKDGLGTIIVLRYMDRLTLLIEMAAKVLFHRHNNMHVCAYEYLTFIFADQSDRRRDQETRRLQVLKRSDGVE